MTRRTLQPSPPIYRPITLPTDRDALPPAAYSIPGWDQTITMPTGAGDTGRRNVAEGYRRGWGLQYGELAEQVDQAPLFRAAIRAAREADTLSLLPDVRLKNLYLLLTEGLPTLDCRNIIEFGSFRGGTAIFLAIVLRAIDPTARVYALDTFEGIPEGASSTVDLHHAGDFDSVDLSRVRARAAELGLDNLTFVKGRIEDTLPDLLRDGRRFGLAHIDCDIRSAVTYSEQTVWPAMTPGGYLIFDDADASSCIGATQAVEEMVIRRRVHSEQAWPHQVFRAEAAPSPESSLLSLLGERRQSRSFLPGPLDPDVLTTLLGQMDLAPSVGNSRPWRIVQVGSADARQQLVEIFSAADTVTRQALDETQAAKYDQLGMAGFLEAPVQLSVFTEMTPNLPHRQGWTTFPEALVHSTVGALHTLWLAAEASGLGFAWISTVEPSAMEKAFAPSPTWRFTAHIALGHSRNVPAKPRHELVGWMKPPPTKLVSI